MKYRQIHKSIALGVLIAGLLLRLVVYLQNRNLALDEQSLALNICERDWTGLFCCLDYQQHFPPFSLVLVEWMTQLTGISDSSLRFWPFLAGVLSLYLFYRIAKKEFQFPWLPLLIFAGSVFVLRYQTEFKQYSLDILASVLFLFFLTRPKEKWRTHRPAIGLFFLFSFWFSMPAIFLVAALWLFAYVRKLIWRKQLWFLSLGIGLSFVFLYLVNLDESVASDHLQTYHEQYFLQLHPANWGQNVDLLLSLLGAWLDSTAFTIGAFLLLFALGVLNKRQRWSVAAILLVFLLTGIASFGHFYSFIPRLLLFWVPLLLWIIALGFDRTVGFLESRKIPRVVTWTTVILLFVFPLNFYQQGWAYFFNNYVVDRPLEVMQQVENSIKPGDAIWVTQYGSRAVNYYSGCTGQSALNNHFIRYFDHPFSQDSILNALDNSSEKRIWILDTHDCEQFLNRLEHRFVVHEKIRAGDSGTVLIEKK